jgi:hypothetical protein
MNRREEIEKIINELTKTQLLELGVYSAKLVLLILEKYIPGESVFGVITEKAERILNKVSPDTEFEDFMRMQLAASELKGIYEFKCKEILLRVPEGASCYIAEGLIEAVYAFTGICDSRVIDGTQLSSVLRAAYCVAAGEAIGDLDWTEANLDMVFAKGKFAADEVLEKIINKADEIRERNG